MYCVRVDIVNELVDFTVWLQPTHTRRNESDASSHNIKKQKNDTTPDTATGRRLSLKHTKAMSDIEKTSMVGFRVSELSEILQDVDTLQLAKEMDSDGDGFINDQDLAAAMRSMQASRKENKSLKRIGCGLLWASLLLAGSTIGASIAAARVSNDTTVDNGGVLHAKGTGAIVKTQEALDWSTKPDVLGMSTRELVGLRDLILLDGNVHFRIKGFTKAPSQDKVTLLVEGGTVTFGENGIVDATGSVMDSYSMVLGSGAGDESQRELSSRAGVQSQRKLPLSCEFGCWIEHQVDSSCGICWWLCNEDCGAPVITGECNGCDDGLYTGFGNDVP